MTIGIVILMTPSEDQSAFASNKTTSIYTLQSFSLLFALRYFRTEVGVSKLIPNVILFFKFVYNDVRMPMVSVSLIFVHV